MWLAVQGRAEGSSRSQMIAEALASLLPAQNGAQSPEMLGSGRRERAEQGSVK